MSGNGIRLVQCPYCGCYYAQSYLDNYHVPCPHPASDPTKIGARP